MKRVTGIGGIFIKSPDPEQLKAWYKEHLGMNLEEWGGMVFQWQTPENPNPDGMTVWSVFDAASPYFAPSTAPFMVNYRVDDLQALLDALRTEGCDVDDKVEDSEFGKFGWVMDPDGNRVELWEPPASAQAE
jgi:predicted enzyme related to lactoylglutathione lyase